ncbi:hypothetical protein [Lacunimicrobium album]
MTATPTPDPPKPRSRWRRWISLAFVLLWASIVMLLHQLPLISNTNS